jgi:uncharacterized SAM-binding protein YcdF (DUF218 family)
VGAAVGAAAGFVVKDLDLPALVSYPGEREPLVVLVAVLGGLAWISPLRRWFAVGASALGVLWCVVAFTPLSLWLAEGLPRHDPVENADAILVMASARRADGSGALSRLFHGVELLAEGRAPRLVLSEMEAPDRSYADEARTLMRRLSLKQELEIVQPVRNTRDEAVRLAALYRERGWKLVLVVTSPAHSRRASAALEREGVEVVSSPSRETRFDLEALDTWKDRLAAFGTLMHERVGILVYDQRGWLASPTS